MIMNTKGKHFAACAGRFSLFCLWRKILIDRNDNSFEQTVSSIAESLLAAVRRGDEDAWRKLVSAYGGMIYAWIRMNAVPAHDADDIRQKVIKAVYGSVGEFRRDKEGHTFRGWLRRITNNKVIDYWRKKGRAKETIHENQFEKRLNEISIEEYGDDLSSQFTEKEEQALVFRQLLAFVEQSIKDQHWEIFKLVVEGKLTREEIAEQYGMKRSNVDVIYSRVMAKIRERFGDDPFANAG